MSLLGWMIPPITFQCHRTSPVLHIKKAECFINTVLLSEIQNSYVISHMKFQLILNVLETAYSSIIRSWCDEWHSHLMYLYTQMLSQPKEQQSRPTQRTAVAFITSFPDDRGTNGTRTLDTDGIFAHLTTYSCYKSFKFHACVITLLHLSH